MNYVESLEFLGLPAMQLPCIRGKGPPSEGTSGVPGVLYMDTDADNGDLYLCTAAVGGVYTWKPLTASIQEQVDSLADEVAALNPFKCSSVRLVPNVAVMGATIDSVSVNWSFNKTPVSLTVQGETVEPTQNGSYTLSELNLREKYTVMVKATDARGDSVTASTSLNFYNGIYYGVMADGAEINSDTVKEMMPQGPEIQNSRVITFTASAGAGQRIGFAIPNRSPYGTPTFKDKNTGFQAGFYLADTVPVENAYGYTEDYNVWLSNHPGIGQITVEVT